MKSLVLCVILVAGIQTTVIPFPPDQNEKANNIVRGCIEETGITFEVLSELSKGNVPDDENLKNFAYCFFRITDFVTSDGQLNIDVIMSKLPPGFDKTDTQKLLEICKSKTGKDVVNTVFEIFKCYYYGTKIHLKLDFTLQPTF